MARPTPPPGLENPIIQGNHTNQKKPNCPPQNRKLAQKKGSKLQKSSTTYFPSSAEPKYLSSNGQ